MKELKAKLRSSLEGAGRLAVLGIGSRLRGDDFAGMLAAGEFNRLITDERPDKLRVYLGEDVPENFTGPIKEFAPTHLIIIDAMDMGRNPAEAAVFGFALNSSEVSFSTHRLPLKVMADYLNHFFECRVIFIGIQPQDLAFGAKVSSRVIRASKKVASIIKECALEALSCSRNVC